MLKDPRRIQQLQLVIQRLGLPSETKVNYLLLDRALTHPSVSTNNYEHLEFVGDAVMRLVAAEVLLETYPEAPVGEFAAIRSILVSDRLLAELCDSYGLDRYLVATAAVLLNKGGRKRLLADTFEAILGALYLSTKNMELIRPWLDARLLEEAEKVRQDPALQNYKDALQEWSQGQYKTLPQYRVRKNELGPEAKERFIAEVWLEDRKLGEGKGETKKAAEQEAAKDAFKIVQLKNYRITPPETTQ